jgi:hypothetical protein
MHLANPLRKFHAALVQVSIGFVIRNFCRGGIRLLPGCILFEVRDFSLHALVSSTARAADGLIAAKAESANHEQRRGEND